MALLRAAGKLGIVASQFPPYFVAAPSNSEYIARARDDAQRVATMRFLRSHRLYYTSIDAPEDDSIVPSFIEATGDQAYMRFHGKNRTN